MKVCFKALCANSKNILDYLNKKMIFLDLALLSLKKSFFYAIAEPEIR